MQEVTPKANYRTAFSILTVLFFMWGFITCLNDLLIPHLKEAFELSIFQAMLIQTAFFGAYFFISLFYFLYSASRGDPIAHLGYQKGLVIGLVICACGCALFYPAAELHIYGLFLAALFILASGVTIIQIAANPYVAILGPEKSASSRLNLAQGLNSLGTTVAPVLGGILIFRKGLIGADSVKLPYLGLAGVFAILAFIFSRISLPNFKSTQKPSRGAGALKYPFLVLGMIAIFVYVGAEVSIGSIFIQYLGLADVVGLPKEEADKFLSFYWGGLMLGRFMGAIALNKDFSDAKRYGYMAIAGITVTFIVYLVASGVWQNGVWQIRLDQIYPYFGLMVLNYIAFLLGQSKPGRMMGIFSIVAILLLLTTLNSSGLTAMWTVIGIGMFNSIMWSNIFTLSIDGLGKHKSQGSSLLVMMVVGGAVLPPLQGLMADQPSIGIKGSFALVLVCYLYLAFYGFRGHKIGKGRHLKGGTLTANLSAES